MDKRTKSPLNSMSKFLLTVMVTLLFCSVFSTGQERIARIRRKNIPFKGNATGGTLVLSYATSPHYVPIIHSVSIDTSAGESAESVVSRLARAVVYSDAIYARSSRSPNAEAMVANMAQGSALSFRGGSLRNYLLAGSETGLGIPKPPLSLNASYHKKAGTLDVKWINPPDDFSYDSIYIRWRYRSRPEDTPGSGGAKFFTDKPTSYTIKIPAEVNDLDTDIWLGGFRHEVPVDELRAKDIPLLTNAIPSNVAAIHVTSNGYCQEETYGIPFFAGIAPNWAGWSTAAKVDKAAFEQGDKYSNLPAHRPWYHPRVLLTKPFYQIIKAPPQGVVHGVYRKFLGLTPGHTYRLTACLTTLQMDSMKGDWSLLLCAAHNGPDGKDLTVQQLAGLAPLPDGRSGPQAGRIASYGPGITTKGDFSLVFSGKNAPSGWEASHITLPDGVDTITVWVRFICSGPKGEVGFSGVKLEDISAIPDPKMTEQILLEEHQQEVKLLKWIEKATSETVR